MGFRFSALPRERFVHLFGLSDNALKAHGVIRRHADESSGFPCRVSLQDAARGEPVLLLNFEHQPVPTPFRASHAIYVREGAEEVRPAPSEVPEVIRRRLISLRAFDEAGMLVDADVADGAALEAAIEQLLSNPDAAYLHAHYAKPGCFAARIDRV